MWGERMALVGMRMRVVLPAFCETGETWDEGEFELSDLSIHDTLTVWPLGMLRFGGATGSARWVDEDMVEGCTELRYIGN
jgi:hypothetical protein